MILVDGLPADAVSVADRGLNYGDGLFETMRLHGGRVPLLHRHLARLAAGCERLGIPCPPEDEIAMDVARLAEAGAEGVVKVVVTRGDGGRGYAPPAAPRVRRIVGLHRLPANPEEPVELGLCVTPLGYNPRLAGIKHLNRLEQVLAAGEAAGAGWYDGLMLDDTGAVAEATRHHLFLVSDGRLRTPVLERGGVTGIMRALVLESAGESGFDHEEVRIIPEDLAAAEEAFLTNAVTGVVAVDILAGKRLDRGSAPQRLAPALRRRGVTWVED